MSVFDIIITVISRVSEREEEDCY